MPSPLSGRRGIIITAVPGRKGPRSQRYIREEALAAQLRQAVQTVFLSDAWAKKMLGKIKEWKTKVEARGFEPLTSCMRSKRSPAELRPPLTSIGEASDACQLRTAAQICF